MVNSCNLWLNVYFVMKALFNTLRPRQNGRLFADDTFKRIFLNEKIRISIKISLKFVPRGLINNIPALVLIMAWHRQGDKPLSEPMMVRSLTHICVTRPQRVKKQFLQHKDTYRSSTYMITGIAPLHVNLSSKHLRLIDYWPRHSQVGTSLWKYDLHTFQHPLVQFEVIL